MGLCGMNCFGGARACAALAKIAGFAAFDGFGEHEIAEAFNE